MIGWDQPLLKNKVQKDGEMTITLSAAAVRAIEDAAITASHGGIYRTGQSLQIHPDADLSIDIKRQILVVRWQGEEMLTFRPEEFGLFRFDKQWKPPQPFLLNLIS